MVIVVHQSRIQQNENRSAGPTKKISFKQQKAQIGAVVKNFIFAGKLSFFKHFNVQIIDFCKYLIQCFMVAQDKNKFDRSLVNIKVIIRLINKLSQ
jgi:hypothetical protein